MNYNVTYHHISIIINQIIIINMVNSNLHWTENRLSDTVVEFKASTNKKRNIINELIIGNFHYNLH